MTKPALTAIAALLPLALASGAARTLTAQQLEAGDGSIAGRLGAEVGKWRLRVSVSPGPQLAIAVVAP